MLKEREDTMKKIFYFLSFFCIHFYLSSNASVEGNFYTLYEYEIEEDEPGRYAPNTSGQVNWITDGDEEKAEKKDFP